MARRDGRGPGCRCGARGSAASLREGRPRLRRRRQVRAPESRAPVSPTPGPAPAPARTPRTASRPALRHPVVRGEDDASGERRTGAARPGRARPGARGAARVLADALRARGDRRRCPRARAHGARPARLRHGDRRCPAPCLAPRCGPHRGGAVLPGGSGRAAEGEPARRAAALAAALEPSHPPPRDGGAPDQRHPRARAAEPRVPGHGHRAHRLGALAEERADPRPPRASRAPGSARRAGEAAGDDGSATQADSGAVRMTFDPNAAASPDSGIFGLNDTPESARVVLVPVPFEATTSYGGGTSEGPAAILRASRPVDLWDLA